MYDPDILLPETVPVYATTPTAPKLIALPDSVPVIFRLSAGDESMIVPFTLEPVWFHVSVKVPLNGPLYDPDQLPATCAAVDAAVGVGVAGGAVAGGAVGVAATVGALPDAVGVGAFDEEPHAAMSAAALNPAVMMTMARCIENPPLMLEVFKSFLSLTRLENEPIRTGGGGVLELVDLHRPGPGLAEHLTADGAAARASGLLRSVRAVKAPLKVVVASALLLEVDDLTRGGGEGVVVPSPDPRDGPAERSPRP